MCFFLYLFSWSVLIFSATSDQVKQEQAQGTWSKFFSYNMSLAPRTAKVTLSPAPSQPLLPLSPELQVVSLKLKSHPGRERVVWAGQAQPQAQLSLGHSG